MDGEITRREDIQLERTQRARTSGHTIAPGSLRELVTVGHSPYDPYGPGERHGSRSKLSARLRGLLDEPRREHSCNRAIMQIELSVMDHPMQALALDGQTHGYDPRGSALMGRSNRARRA